MTTIVTTKPCYMLHLPAGPRTAEHWLNMAHVRSVAILRLQDKEQEIAIVFSDGTTRRYYGIQAKTILKELEKMEQGGQGQ